MTPNREEKPLRPIKILLLKSVLRVVCLASPALLVACACNNSSSSPKLNASPTASQSTDSNLKQGFTGGGCVRTGCSGTICAPEGEPTFSTCQWREEYICYKTERCEKQANGQCGWTPSASLDACLKDKSAR